MKKNKGFTLIELLAVILILGIIALIAIPTVNNIVKEAKKGAFKTSIKNILDAIETKCEMQLSKGEEVTKTYTFTSTEVTPSIDVKGSLPTSGTITLNDECKVTNVNTSDGTYTATIENEKLVVSIGESVVKVCKLKNGSALAIGSEYECDPGDGTKRTFFVLENTDATKVSLIMDRNIDNETVAWSSDGSNHKKDNESAQAATVKAKMNAATSEWTKVTVTLPTANQIAAVTNPNAWDSATSTNLFYFSSGTTTSEPTVQAQYKWLYNYTNECSPYGCDASTSLTSGAKGYWTSSLYSALSYSAWGVSRSGSLYGDDVGNGSHFGMRPVITVSKSDVS